MIVLTGDIGGTKTLLQLSEPDKNGFKVYYEQRFVSADFTQFETMLQTFMDNAVTYGAAPDAACFGVAGPVNGRNARTTNLPWTLNADQLETRFNIPRVRLINDFQSIGYGIEALHKNDLVTLQTGTEVKQGNRAIIGAGTGLGHGLLVWQQDHYEVVASEAGHTSFAPTDELQTELL
ncbi:MAG TPA: glucokinase, partial [Gammaproteobacteria bacterium]